MKLFGLCFFAVLMTACASSSLDTAVYSANAARSTEVVAGELLRERCTDRYRAAANLKTAAEIRARVAELDRGCLPARKAYGVLRAGRLALLAAITAYKVSQNEAQLLTAVTRAASAATAAAEAVEAIPE